MIFRFFGSKNKNTRISSVKLFEESREEIKISIHASILGNHDLVIEGIDSGSLVEQLKGDWDYEYYLTVKSPDKELLMRKIGESKVNITNDKELLNWIQDNYSGNHALSSFQKLLEAQNIEYKMYSWR